MKISTLVAAALLCSTGLAAHAAKQDEGVGPYAGVEVGRTSFSLASSLPVSNKDQRGDTIKLFGGYNFNQWFGVEGGYARLGSFSETATVGSGSVKQDGSARSFFGAVTARAQLGESFAAHARLGLSAGKVNGTNLLPAGDELTGSKRSVMFGVGAEYKLTPNVALTVDYDNYGKVSNKVKASTLGFGARVSF